MELIRNDEQNVHVDVQSQKTKLHTTYMDFDENNLFWPCINYITGIDYEPWHFRYVGKDAAMIIMDQGITLEEFVENISE